MPSPPACRETLRTPAAGWSGDFPLSDWRLQFRQRRTSRRCYRNAQVGSRSSGGCPSEIGCDGYARTGRWADSGGRVLPQRAALGREARASGARLAQRVCGLPPNRRRRHRYRDCLEPSRSVPERRVRSLQHRGTILPRLSVAQRSRYARGGRLPPRLAAVVRSASGHASGWPATTSSKTFRTVACAVIRTRAGPR